jgi:hypothetical protein
MGGGPLLQLQRHGDAAWHTGACRRHGIAAVKPRDLAYQREAQASATTSLLG